MNNAKLRKQGSEKYPSYSLTVPIEIVKQLPQVDLVFRPEITGDGILFRVIGHQVIEPPPNWPQ